MFARTALQVAGPVFFATLISSPPTALFAFQRIEANSFALWPMSVRFEPRNSARLAADARALFPGSPITPTESRGALPQSRLLRAEVRSIGKHALQRSLGWPKFIPICSRHLGSRRRVARRSTVKRSSFRAGQGAIGSTSGFRPGIRLRQHEMADGCVGPLRNFSGGHSIVSELGVTTRARSRSRLPHSKSRCPVHPAARVHGRHDA